MKMHRFALAVAALCLSPALVFAAPETYQIDPVHSFLIFKVRHFNVGNAYGEFNSFKGSFTRDKEAPETNKLTFEVDANSLDTKNEKRDQHVKSPDFLNVKQFPTITYKTDSCKKLSENQFELAGQLTLHGVTKPLTLKLEKIGEGADPQGKYRIGGETTFTIKRSEFGMTNMLQNLGDEITCTVAVEGIRQDQ